MRAFKDTLSDCELSDIGYLGSPFTWQKRCRGGHQVFERLDRGVATPAWRIRFPNAKVKHLFFAKSDHLALFVPLGKSRQGRRKGLWRYEAMWAEDERSNRVVDRCWSIGQTDMMARLEGCKRGLAVWNNEEFGQVRAQLREKEVEAQSIITQNEELLKFDRLIELEKDIAELNRLDTVRWQQRAKAMWLKDGDRNSAFFHKMASEKRRRKKIEKIIVGEGQEVEGQEEISGAAFDYFSGIFLGAEHVDPDVVTTLPSLD